MNDFSLKVLSMYKNTKKSLPLLAAVTLEFYALGGINVNFKGVLGNFLTEHPGGVTSNDHFVKSPKMLQIQ